MKEQRVKRQRKTKKKIILNSKKEFVRDDSFMTSTKNLTFGPPPTSSPLYTIIQFWNFDLSRSHSWTSLIRIQNPLPAPWVISNSFLIVNAYSIYYSHMYYKPDRKANSFSPVRLFAKGCLWCFHCRTTSQVQKMFQDRNSVIGKHKV